MKKVATIILNRNLPSVTDTLYKNILKYNKKYTDVYIVEAGSDSGNLSKNMTWNADWKEAKLNGLRYARGMNFGLSNLWREGKFDKYEAFLLLTNDTEFKTKSFIKIFLDIFKKHPRLGILSPCSKDWGEKKLIDKNSIKYFWYIHNTAYFLRKDFIKEIINLKTPGYMNFLFDGNNFRGYGTESELIAKAYSNHWAAGITNQVWAEENEKYLKKLHSKIKTNTFEENNKLVMEESREWMREKYGFKSKWSLQMYVKTFYDRFFTYYPELKKNKV